MTGAQKADGNPKEVEITTAMADAGFGVLVSEAGVPGDVISARFDPREAALAVYRAMEVARRENC